MTKNELQNGDIVQLRNGNFYIYMDGNIDSFIGLSSGCERIGVYEYADDLSLSGCPEFDVMHVYRYNDLFVGSFLREIVRNPASCAIMCTHIFERKSNPKKMTVSEISEALGYDVEIIKG